MQIDGQGNLRSGFRGRLAAAMPNAGGKGCGLANLRAMLDIAMQDGRPHLSGPLRGEALACRDAGIAIAQPAADVDVRFGKALDRWRSEEHTSELQSLMRISYAVFCL